MSCFPKLDAFSLLTLEDGGIISASTVTGDGGSITLEIGTLVLRRGGRIATDAGNSDGGNITINTDVLAALGNSDITANAEAGFGGRVSIAATGIFGTQFRQQLTPESDITATSNLGANFSGVVAIDTPDVDPTSGLLKLPENLRDPSEAIAPGCQAFSGSEFYIVGRGGLPTNPLDPLGGDLAEIDLVEPARVSETSQNSASQNSASQNSATSRDRLSKTNRIIEIIEANGWIVNDDGSVELIARPNASAGNTWYRPADCGDLQAEG